MKTALEVILMAPVVVGALWLAWKFAKAQEDRERRYHNWRLSKLQEYRDNPNVDLSVERFLDEEELERQARI